jgi:hypothetical protein
LDASATAAAFWVRQRHPHKQNTIRLSKYARAGGAISPWMVEVFAAKSADSLFQELVEFRSFQSLSELISTINSKHYGILQERARNK